LKPALPNPLVRVIFELRIMVINGEYTEHPPRQVSDSANYAWEYIIATPIENLYTFIVKDEVLQELKANVEINKKRFIDRQFHSLEILEMMADGMRK
jgi:DNA repair protein RecO (recombination protein O)